jgi:hypothetical protein
MKVRKKGKRVHYVVKNTQGATDISKWCLGEGIREEKALDRVMKYWSRLLQTERKMEAANN